MYFRIDLFLDINLYCNIRYVFLSFDQIKTHYYYYYVVLKVVNINLKGCIITNVQVNNNPAAYSDL